MPFAAALLGVNHEAKENRRCRNLLAKRLVWSHVIEFLDEAVERPLSALQAAAWRFCRSW